MPDLLNFDLVLRQDDLTGTLKSLEKNVGIFAYFRRELDLLLRKILVPDVVNYIILLYELRKFWFIFIKELVPHR